MSLLELSVIQSQRSNYEKNFCSSYSIFIADGCSNSLAYKAVNSEKEVNNQFNERISSGNCVLSGTEELWKSVDVIIAKKYNCADSSVVLKAQF